MRYCSLAMKTETNPAWRLSGSFLGLVIPWRVKSHNLRAHIYGVATMTKHCATHMYTPTLWDSERSWNRGAESWTTPQVVHPRGGPGMWTEAVWLQSSPSLGNILLFSLPRGEVSQKRTVSHRDFKWPLTGDGSAYPRWQCSLTPIPVEGTPF